MKQLVSDRWTYAVGSVATMAAVCSIFIPGFPLAGLVWVGLTFSVVLWLSRRQPRSTAQILWDLEGERAVAVPKRLADPVPGDIRS